MHVKKVWLQLTIFSMCVKIILYMYFIFLNIVEGKINYISMEGRYLPDREM